MAKGIKKITICGYGLIGGCIAMDLLKGKPSYEITAYDRKPVLDRLKRSRTHNVTVEYKLSNAVIDSDIVILSATHKANEQLLAKIAGMKDLNNCLIIDTGAVKGEITKLAEKLSFDGSTQFLPSHPMAGKEKAGYENSASGLFKEHAWYLCDDIKLNPKNRYKADWLVKKVKAMRVDISSDLHDELVSEISHLPQLISTILGGQINPALIPLAGPGLKSMLRLAGSPYSVWQEIIAENKTEIIKTLRIYSENLNKVIDHIEEDESLEEIFKESSRSYKCL